MPCFVLIGLWVPIRWREAGQFVFRKVVILDKMLNKIADWLAERTWKFWVVLLCLVLFVWFLVTPRPPSVQERINMVLELEADEGTLCDDFTCDDEFPQYVFEMRKRIGPPYEVVEVEPIVSGDDGGIIVHWRYGDDSISLHLRRVGRYWRSQRLRPMIVYLRGPWRGRGGDSKFLEGRLLWSLSVAVSLAW